MKTVKISQGAGDIIASVPYLKALGGSHVYMVNQIPDVPDWHPMNHGGLNSLIPFLEMQGISSQVIPWNDVCLYAYDINIDTRAEHGWLGAWGDIYTWNAIFHGVYPDMTQQFLYVEDVEPKNCIAITQTARYLNPAIDYRALNDYSCDKIMIGNEAEYNFMMELYPGLKNIEYVKTENFYEASKVLKSSRLYISNQTALAVVAEGIAHNRILVVCKEYPSVIMKTPKGRPVLTQKYFEKAIADML